MMEDDEDEVQLDDDNGEDEPGDEDEVGHADIDSEPDDERGDIGEDPFAARAFSANVTRRHT